MACRTGDKVQIGIPKPEKVYVRHGAGQRKKVQNSLALDVVSHGDHGFFVLLQVVLCAKAVSVVLMKREKVGINAV